jgi:putative PIG3 family NAD(P)H quinone oxidoreductase
MRAVTVVGPDLIEIREHPDPKPRAGEAVVRVHGAGINRADLLQKAGFYPAPEGSPPDIPGLELAGVVESLGEGVTHLAPGDRVLGISGGGGQAELAAVPAVQLARVPDSLDLVAAGSVPEVFVTAHDGMVTQGRLQRDEWLLIHAVGSGVGTAAVQLGKALGAQVAGTARTADKLERARDLGLDVGIVPATGSDGALDPAACADQIREATGGVDVVLDLVGGRYVEVDIAASNLRGRVVLVGALAGGSADLAVLTVMQRRLSIHGTVLRTRSVVEKGDAMVAFAADVLPLFADGRIGPIVDATFPLEAAAEAYDLVASNTTFGKVVLDLT